MLSDRDRETLDEIQHQLVTEDPQFAGSFDNGAHRLAAHGRRAHQSAVTVMLVVALLFTALMIAVHAAGPAFFFTAASSWLIWLRWGHRRRDRHLSP